MIVVSDASPVINLAVIGKLDLLKDLYGVVIIPRTVHEEVNATLLVEIGKQLSKLDWLETRAATNESIVTELELELDRGEAEAIVLAKELNANLLLIDERKGRQVADRMGLKFIGLLGVLVEAKQKRLISEIKPLVDALMTKAGFWISPRLYRLVLESAGE